MASGDGFALWSNRLAGEYIAATGLWGLCVVGPETGRPVRMLCSQATKRRLPEGSKLHSVLWCASERSARAIIDKCRCWHAPAKLKGGWYDIEARLADDTFCYVAMDLGISLQTDDDVRSHAEQMFAKVETEFALLWRKNGLRELNAAYRAYRLGRLADGQRPQLYQRWLATQRQQMIRHAVLAMAGEIVTGL